MYLVYRMSNVTRGTSWKTSFRHCFIMGKVHIKVDQKKKRESAEHGWVQSRADIQTVMCPIGTGQTQMSQELTEEENRMRLVEQYLHGTCNDAVIFVQR